MGYRRIFVFCLSMVIGCALVRHEVFACSCIGYDRETSLETFDRTPQVLIAKLTSIQPKIRETAKTVRMVPSSDEEPKLTAGDVSSGHSMPGDDGDVFHVVGIPAQGTLVTMVVEKTYKGSLVPGEEIVFDEGLSGCAYPFTEEDIDHEYLLYLNKPEGASPRYQLSKCTRSSRVEASASDVLFFDRLPEARNRTRISGQLRSDVILNTPDFNGLKISVIPMMGTMASYQKVNWDSLEKAVADNPENLRSIVEKELFDGMELVTDRNGAFELYDIKEGLYIIRPKMPDGWKPGWMVSGKNINRFPISVLGLNPAESTIVQIGGDGSRQLNLDILFFPDNAIRGRLTGGKRQLPHKDSCLYAERIDDGKKFWKPGFAPNFSGCTNEKGEFTISGLPDGEYVLVANPSGYVSFKNPFKTFYYPGVADKKQAEIFSMTPKVFYDDIVVQIPKIEDVIRISGEVVFPDGEPLKRAGASVAFRPEADAAGINYQHADNGVFHFDIIKGTAGTLSAIVSTSWFSDCPGYDKLLEEFEQNFTSKEIRVSGMTDRDDIRLVFPIPYCEKAAVFE